MAMLRSQAAIAIAIGVLLTACSKSPSAPGASTVRVTGRYDLKTVNGQALPFRHIDGRVVLSESFFIAENGRYTQSSTFCENTAVEECTSDRAETVTDISGTYVVNGAQISFVEETYGRLRFGGTVSSDGRQLDLTVDHPLRGRTRRVYAAP